MEIPCFPCKIIGSLCLSRPDRLRLQYEPGRTKYTCLIRLCVAINLISIKLNRCYWNSTYRHHKIRHAPFGIFREFSLNSKPLVITLQIPGWCSQILRWYLLSRGNKYDVNGACYVCSVYRNWTVWTHLKAPISFEDLQYLFVYRLEGLFIRIGKQFCDDDGDDDD